MRRPAAALSLGALVLASLPLAAVGYAQSTQEPVRIEEAAVANTNGPEPIGVENDVYCSGWLGGVDERFVGTIASAEGVDSRSVFMQGDIVYLDIGASRGVAPGQEFWICRPDRLVYKYGSVTDELGRIYTTPGRVRVICAQEDAAIAEIVRTCNEVEIGDRLLVFEPIPIPLVARTALLTSCDPGSGKTAGHIVDVKDAAVPIATTTVVYLDLGERDGLVAGDFLSVFRTRHAAGGVRTMLGEVAILKTQPHTAVAVVTNMSDTMYAGDQVELK